MKPKSPLREVPPTAGMPTHFADFLPYNSLDNCQSALSAMLGLPISALLSSGTACLLIALRALRRTSARGSVIVSAYTCPLVVFAIEAAGLRCVVCDLARASFELDLLQLRALSDSDTLAVICTHLAGQVSDANAALRIAESVGAVLIEDAAQAMGARFGAATTPAVGGVGCMAFFSFALGKGLCTFEGGALVVNDASLLDHVNAELAALPARPLLELWRCLQLFAYYLFYRPRLLRWVYGTSLRRALDRGDWISALGEHFSRALRPHRLGRWRAMVARNALTRWPGFLSANSDRAHRRYGQIDTIFGCHTLVSAPSTHAVWPVLVLCFDAPETCQYALKLLAGAGLGVSRLYAYALPDYPYLTLPKSATENARNMALRCLSISNSAWLSEADFTHILQLLRQAAEHTAATPTPANSAS